MAVLFFSFNTITGKKGLSRLISPILVPTLLIRFKEKETWQRDQNHCAMWQIQCKFPCQDHIWNTAVIRFYSQLKTEKSLHKTWKWKPVQSLTVTLVCTCTKYKPISCYGRKQQPQAASLSFWGKCKKKILSRKIQHDKKYNDTLLLDCIAVLPVCQCMLLSTTITSTLAEFIYIYTWNYLKINAVRRKSYLAAKAKRSKRSVIGHKAF